MTDKEEVDSSVPQLWEDFIRRNAELLGTEVPSSFYFCDNKMDADQCLDLVLAGEKKGTATALWWYEHHKEPLPQPKDYFIITSWEGVARCIVQITDLKVVKFKNVDLRFAEIEGEGDKTLEYWRKVHQAYYEREFAQHDVKFSEEMMVVCECFQLVHHD